MAYSDFTLRKAKEELNLSFLEGGRFLPKTEPIAPSPYLAEFLAESIPLAIAFGTSEADRNRFRKSPF
jgi:hypothetical protein